MPQQDVAHAPYPNAIKKFPIVRQSLLSTFDQCPLLTKFDLEYRKGWSSHPQGRGQIFHRFAAKALRLMVEQEERTIEVDVALELLRECLRQHDVPDDEVVTVPFKEIKDLRWVVVKFANENIFDIQYLAAVEEEFRVPTPSYPNADGEMVERVLKGTLDTLFIPQEDWAVVLDWKDSWNLPPQDELSGSGYFQQRFYAYLVMSMMKGIERVTLREHYVRHKADGPRGDNIREATVFRSELPNIQEELCALVERFDRAVQHGTWPLPEPPEDPKLWTPSPGAHCGFCPRPTACPIFPNARVEGAITNESQAKQSAAEQTVAKAAVKQRDKGLRAWADNKGPIPIKHAKDPNRVLGYQATERTSRPTEQELKRALEEQGADFDPATVYKTSTSTRFGAHTRTGPSDEPEDLDLTKALEESIERQSKKKR